MNREFEIHNSGDCAKLREAVKCLMDNLNIHLMMPSEQITINRAELEAMVKDCSEAALSAPPRNCDVGTAEEQKDRYVRFCDSHMKNHGNCFGCAALKPRGRCEFAWAQMPYESEVGK